MLPPLYCRGRYKLAVFIDIFGDVLPLWGEIDQHTAKVTIVLAVSVMGKLIKGAAHIGGIGYDHHDISLVFFPVV